MSRLLISIGVDLDDTVPGALPLLLHHLGLAARDGLSRTLADKVIIVCTATHPGTTLQTITTTQTTTTETTSSDGEAAPQ